MLAIDAAMTSAALPFQRLVPALADAFRDSSYRVPPRHTHVIGSGDGAGTSLVMPAWCDGFYGVKIVNIWPGNRTRRLPGL
ncbi:MAG: ornithine cyclodeaminase family protein, partial [Burkholderiales bacterium]